MPRIHPISKNPLTQPVENAFKKHVEDYNSRITNMKATLAHSLLAFEVYMQWYPLYEQVQGILGTRLAYLFSYAVSHASNCPLCSTFFRKLIIDGGEDPEQLRLSGYEQDVLDFGSAIAMNQGHIDDHVYARISAQFPEESVVILVAFAGQMIATNIFNNVIETDIDEYLQEYKPSVSIKPVAQDGI